MSKSVSQIGQNILVQIRRPNRSKHTYILVQICLPNRLEYTKMNVDSLEVSLLYHHNSEFGQIGREGQNGREGHIGSEADRFGHVKTV